MNKKIEDLPVVGDTITFQLETFDQHHKLTGDPFSFNSITVYSIERELADNSQLYLRKSYNKEIEAEISNLQKICAKDPSHSNICELNNARVRLEATSVKHPYTFKDGKIVFSSGTVGQPLWASQDNVHIKKIGQGIFEFEWDTSACKEGNYYVVWSWTPEKGGKELKSNKMFLLYADQTPIRSLALANRSIPKDKYDFLIRKYLPSMYKTKVANDDITYQVLGEGLNWCIARELTGIENALLMLTDSYDANICPPFMLQLLGNFYNLKLRTEDIILQRRQVQNAIPLFKMKGTKKGLETALDQSGIKLKKITLLWEVKSPYTWTESFTVGHDGQDVFELGKMPIDDKLDFFLRSQNNEYILLPPGYFLALDSLDGSKKMITYQEQPDNIKLLQGDILKVSYQVEEMPKDYKQIQDYIDSLPLADNRDETKQVYPLKNWNVHLIEEDDPLFDVIVKERHPFFDPITYGKIRTTFLFSENVYNMDTFNGSLRESKSPCDIDRNFLNDCTACQSSKFNVDVEIEDLSELRMNEMMSIIKEYSPFHAQLNVANVCGVVNEFIIMPQEEIEMFMDYSEDQMTETMDHQEEITCLIEYTDGRPAGKLIL